MAMVLCPRCKGDACDHCQMTGFIQMPDWDEKKPELHPKPIPLDDKSKRYSSRGAYKVNRPSLK